MVALIASLKFTLLKNSLRGAGSTTRKASLVASFLYIGLFTTFAGAVLLASRAADAHASHVASVLIGAAYGLGWLILPFATGEGNTAVDPTKYAPLGISARAIGPGAVVSAMISPAYLGSAAVAGAFVLSWTRHPLQLVAAVVAALLSLVTFAVLSCVSVTLAARMAQSRKRYERQQFFLTLAILGFVVASWAGPPLISAIATHLDHPVLRHLMTAASWLPVASAWALPGDLAAGHHGLAAGHALATVAYSVIGYLAWEKLFNDAMHRPVSDDSTSSPAPLRFLDTLGGDSLTGVIWARQMRSILRDPRTRLGYLVLSAWPLLMIIGSIALPDGGSTSMMPTSLALFGTISPQICQAMFGYDGSAVAHHLAAGISTTRELWGRTLAFLTCSFVTALPFCVALVTFLTFSARTEAICSVVLFSLIIAGHGLAALIGVRFPSPAPPAGKSSALSSMTAGSGCAAGFIYFAGLMGIGIAIGVCTIPMFFVPLVAAVPLAVASLAFSVTTLFFTVKSAARRLDHRYPELLAVVSRPA